MMLTGPTRLCRPCRPAEPVHAAATADFSIREGEIPRETDCLLEGTGFELLVRGRGEAGLSRLLTRPFAWEGSAAGGVTRPRDRRSESRYQSRFPSYPINI